MANSSASVLNSHFQSTLNINASMAAGLSAAYFGAYFLCPPTISGWILRRFGFRVTFMTGELACFFRSPSFHPLHGPAAKTAPAHDDLGLSVLAVGCLLFWPAGVKASFGGDCGSMFVVGCGLATLETAADPYVVANTGPCQTSSPYLSTTTH